VTEGDEGLFKDLFVQVTDVKSIFDWCKRILRRILEAMKDQDFKVHKLEAEFVYHFYTQLKRLEEVLLTNNYINDIDTFWKIFNEVITSVKIPFSGEPLKGLQVMGFLETRVLDFENVIMLSVNEDVLPASGNSPSFIPYNIRKAFGLPTYEDQHAVSAFHFYRLIQRAKNIFLIHNTETKSLTTGERSRFLLQLENELKRKYPDSVHINHKVISTKIGKENILEISVNKSPDVMKELSRFLSTPGQRPAALSASGLISYISCPLKFYYRYVAGLKEQDEPEESMEAATFGKVLHKAMQLLYTNVHTVDSKLIAELKKKINDVVDEAIHSEFISLNQLEGKNILLRNVIRELVKRILDSELPEVPFTIMQIEKDVSTEFKVDESKSVRLLGIIDRLDEKNGVLRVVDYKTGKVDKKKPAGLADYFSDPALKEQFQAMYYAFLTRQVIPGKQIKSGLLAMRDMSGGIWFMNGDVPYSEDQFNEFKVHLQKLIEEIFSPAIPFNQTADKDRCLYCAYKSLCNRSAD
jgi:RecB family exonuclease